jgi:hypothetical protein
MTDNEVRSLVEKFRQLERSAVESLRLFLKCDDRGCLGGLDCMANLIGAMRETVKKGIK